MPMIQNILLSGAVNKPRRSSHEYIGNLSGGAFVGSRARSHCEPWGENWKMERMAMTKLEVKEFVKAMMENESERKGDR